MRAIFTRLRGASTIAVGPARPGSIGVTPPLAPVTLDPPAQDPARELGIGCSCSLLRGEEVAVHGRYCPAGVYGKALREAQQMCRNLGLDLAPGSEALSYDVGSLVRYAYGEGWLGCEARITSPNMADLIDLAITTPLAVVERNDNETVQSWTIRAIQQVITTGARQ